MNTYERILKRLQGRYIRAEEIARILALAIESGKNVLLWGPGGHGKSEMVAEVLAEVADEAEIFVQSFGEGMDEATLWGGLDFRALEEEKVLRYHPQNSFLAKKFGVFEELFDAPATVLLALKDTLTAGVLRKGTQQFPMRTKVVIGITNRDPDEIADLGPAAAALVERFPLQLRVAWDSYQASDYVELFDKVGPRLSGAELNGQGKILAELLAKASENGEVISPRTAVHALGVIKTAAALRGSERVEKVDLVDLIFLPGFEQLAGTIREELDAATERAEAETRVRQAERALAALEREMGDASGKPIKLLQTAKRLGELADEVAALKVTDGLSSRRQELRDAVDELIARARDEALAATRI